MNSPVPMALASLKAPNATVYSNAGIDLMKKTAHSVADLVNSSAKLVNASTKAEGATGKWTAKMEATRTVAVSSKTI